MRNASWSVRGLGWILAVSLALGPEAMLLAEPATPEARPAAPDLLFPEDTLVYVACPDAAAAKAAFWQSALGKILSEPAVKEGLSAQRAAFLAFLDALTQQGKIPSDPAVLEKGKALLEKTGLTWEEACGILDGPVAFGWMGAEAFEGEEGKVEARAALIARVKDGERVRGILQTLWRGILAEAPEAGGPVVARQAGGDPVYAFRIPGAGFSPEFVISGHWVLVTTGASTTDAFLSAIAAGSAPRPLANAPRYADCQRRLQGSGVPSVQVYADFGTLLQQAEASLKDLPAAAEAAPKVSKVLDVLGLRGAKAFASVTRFDGMETSAQSVLVTEGTRTGLLALLAGGEAPLPLAGLGKDVAQIGVVRYDPAGFWDLARKVTEAIEPEAVGEAREGLREAEADVGVSFRDLAEALGPEVLVTQGGITGIPGVKDFLVRVRLRDPARASAAIEALLAGLDAQLQGDGMQIATQKLAGQDVRVLRGGQIPVAPCLAITPEWLLIGVTLPGMRKGLEALQPGAAALADGEAFKAATAKVPAKGGSFAFDDLKARFPGDYAQMIQACQMGSMAAAAAGVPMPVDLAALPPAEVIVPHLGPSVARAWSAAEGLRTESWGYVSMSGGPAVVVVVGIAVALLLPAIAWTGRSAVVAGLPEIKPGEDPPDPPALALGKGPKPGEIAAGLRIGVGALACLAALSVSTPMPDQSGLMPLVLVGAVAAFAIPNLMESQKAGNETSAEKAMRILVDAEGNFMRTDYDENGKDFCYNLEGLHDVCDAAGNKIALIPGNLAKGRREGYRFGTVPAFNAQGDTDRRFGFAYYAVPEVYGKTGRRTYLVRHTGEIFYKDTGDGTPPGSWPKDPEAEGWTLLGE